MKVSNFIFLIFLSVIGFHSESMAQKEVIIIEKTIDENGKEISKKIVRKNGEDISDQELNELLQEDSPFGQWDIRSLGFGSDPMQEWEELFNSKNRSSKATLGLSLSFDNDRVTIVDVTPRSGAHDADIRPNDELIAIEGSPISSYEEIELMLSTKESGDEIRVKIYRDGSEIDKIVSLKNNSLGNLSFEFPEGMQGKSFFFDLDGDGADFQFDSMFNLFRGGSMDSIFQQLEGSLGYKSPQKNSRTWSPAPVEERPSLGIYVEDSSNGIEVSEVVPNSPAATAGLQSGDLITRFNDEVVTSYRELSMLMNRIKKGDEVNIEIIRNQQQKQIKAKLD